MNRRTFLRLSAGIAGGVACGGAWSTLVEPGWLQVTRTVIPVSGLPAAFNGFRLLLMTDIHHGPFVSRERIAEAVCRVNEESPDMVILAGDYVIHSPEYIVPCMEELAHIRADMCAVLGNHDHWEDPDLTSDELEETAGARLLRNSGIFLERDDARLRIWGVGDLWEDEQSLDGLRSDGYEGPVILVSHNPDYAEELPEGEVDLVLSGHTHGGQVVLPLIGAPLLPSYFGQKYRSGLVMNGSTAVYVSRGVGVGSPPIRFNCRPELAVIELRTNETGDGPGEDGQS